MPQAKNRSCAASFGKLRCRNCTATFAFLQCGRRFYQKLRCNKRKTALQHWKSCVAGKWRFPAAFLRISSSHDYVLLEDPNKIRSLDCSSLFFLSDNRIRCNELKCSKSYERKAKIACRSSKCWNREEKKERENPKCYYRLGKTA